MSRNIERQKGLACVIYTASTLSFEPELRDWLDKNDFSGYSIRQVEKGDASWSLTLPSTCVRRLFELSMTRKTDKYLPHLVSAIFPRCLLPKSAKGYMLLGKAWADSQDLIKNLAPCNWYPGMRPDLLYGR